MCSNLDSEQAKYLWEYRLHVEKVFYDRMNFYILLESVLLVAIVTIYSNKPITAIIIAICIVGFVVTVIWLYLQVWYKAMLNVLSERVKCRIPAYKEAMKLVKTRVSSSLSSKSSIRYSISPCSSIVVVAFAFSVLNSLRKLVYFCHLDASLRKNHLYT